MIQSKAFDRLTGEMHVPRVRRVERPTEQTDGLPLADTGKTLTHWGLFLIALCPHLG